MLNKSKLAALLMLVLSGAVGAYDFAQSGHDNPLVWALSGKWAPAFWLSLLGLTLLSIFNPKTGKA